MGLADSRSGALRRAQAGETLIESLVAIALLGVLGVVMFTGLQTALVASRNHHQMAVAEAALRSAAEQAQDPRRPSADWCAPDYAQLLPSGYSWQIDVGYWSGMPDPAGSIVPVSINVDDPGQFTAAGCESSDLQKIQLSVRLASGQVVDAQPVLRRRS
jgi:type II secretory pathway pseudopilin PulG